VDRLFRFGGEEFVLLLPGADAASLQPMTHALLDSIRAGLQGAYGPVTASLGAASLRPGEDWQSWLARADAAMYRAKEGGRDRAEVDAG
jgi:diguanylate cyclase (GGDEF)-like protein